MGPFPVEFVIPRDGKMVRLVVHHSDQLRTLRAELELLRRVARLARQSADSSPRSAATLSAADRRELVDILLDARHPLVAETIVRIDRDYIGVKQEIMMSTINDEAQRIIDDAAAAGLTDSRNPVPMSPSPPSAPVGVSAADPTVDVSTDQLAASVEAELAKAEAELAKVASLVDAAPPTIDDPSASTFDPKPSDVSAPIPDLFSEPTTDALRASNPDELVAAASFAPDDASSSSEITLHVPTSAPTMTVGADFFPTGDQGPDAAEALLGSTAHTSDAPPASGTEDDANPDDSPPVNHVPLHDADAFGPRRAAEIATEIEKGVRNLAHLLSTEVADRWQGARQSCDDIQSMSAQLQSSVSAARTFFTEIERIRDEAQIARDDIDVARREARLLRDDVLRAKQRAEALIQAMEKRGQHPQ